MGFFKPRPKGRIYNASFGISLASDVLIMHGPGGTPEDMAAALDAEDAAYARDWRRRLRDRLMQPVYAWRDLMWRARGYPMAWRGIEIKRDCIVIDLEDFGPHLGECGGDEVQSDAETACLVLDRAAFHVAAFRELRRFGFRFIEPFRPGFACGVFKRCLRERRVERAKHDGERGERVFPILRGRYGNFRHVKSSLGKVERLARRDDDGEGRS